MASSDEAVESSGGRFEQGSHLRVKRRCGYMHHGIYVNDNRVIQFGGRVKDKPQATIGPVTLAEFEGGGTAEVVKHGRNRKFWFLVPSLPEAQSAHLVIEQAEWLVANYSPGRYHLIGNNCENIANWCATGWYPESHQVRSGFGAMAMVQFLAFSIGSYRHRTALTMASVSTWTKFAGLLGLVGIAAGMARNQHSKTFWQEYGLKWLNYQRAKK